VVVNFSYHFEGITEMGTFSAILRLMKGIPFFFLVTFSGKKVPASVGLWRRYQDVVQVEGGRLNHRVKELAQRFHSLN
jgi:hypothetical protein